MELSGSGLCFDFGEMRYEQTWIPFRPLISIGRVQAGHTEGAVQKRIRPDFGHDFAGGIHFNGERSSGVVRSENKARIKEIIAIAQFLRGAERHGIDAEVGVEREGSYSLSLVQLKYLPSAIPGSEREDARVSVIEYRQLGRISRFKVGIVLMREPGVGI